MKPYLTLLLLALVLCCSSAQAIDPLPFKDRAEELRFQLLTKQLRCPLCQNESLADSQAGVAKDLRQKVFAMMQAGQSDEQIKTFLTDRYSNFVLYDPPLKGGTLLLWFGPLAALITGGFALLLIVRRRARQAVVVSTTTASEEDW
ncbi:cytochrome c-type biogenesis protein CcmH [Pseudolysobacter antarcticus]|uniref:Cytochrome c-type biogenesis protein n=1 Tax=Pseudolysobacter antarcticus TaxID=2511995 RepID=A0A411HKW8_9GAMM|nr:cytochrome c-type biogenesis protein [Pseudolysobacter antarcticus]QBB71138.1 cytochrome c-type biogenesis protein CcmH [Pseudolysobacter antarcticus]